MRSALRGITDRLGRAWSALRSSSTHPSKEAKWLLEMMAGRETASGVAVTPESAMQLSAVWACVKVLSETVGCLPLHLYERVGRGKERAQSHHLYQLLRTRPNPEMTAMQWKETSMAHLALRGNAYSEIERDRMDRPVALWPMTPTRVQPFRHEKTRELGYAIQLPDGGQRILSADRVLHIRGLSFNGINGLSPISYARETIGLGLAATYYGARFFKNDGRPSGILTLTGKLSDEAYNRMKKTWDEAHSGLDNAHRTAILEEGMKWESVGISMEDAQFLTTREFQVDDTCRIFRMQPHKVQSLRRSTNNNIEHQALEFLSDTIQPWLVRIEEQASITLLSEEERLRFYPEFLVEGLLRADIEKRYRAYALGRQWGWLSVNDIREKENMNPIEGGDVYISPMNMQPATDLTDPKKEPADEDDQEDGRTAKALAKTGGPKELTQ